MKNTWPLTFLGVTVLVLGGIAIYGMAFYSGIRSESRFSALSAAGNCQTDIVAPFLQTSQLGHVKPAAGEDFRTFLSSQVQVGLISDSAAKQALASIESAGQGLPVYTSRGWVMPVIAENSR